MTTFLLIVNRCERFDGGFDSAITMARRRLEAGSGLSTPTRPTRQK
jgi:hypothetical protein